MIAQAETDDFAAAFAKAAPGKVADQSPNGSDDFSAAFDRAAPDHRGDPTKANIDPTQLFRGFGQGALQATKEIPFGLASTVEALERNFAPGRASSSIDWSRGGIAQNIRPAPLPPPQGPVEDIGRTLGSAIPYAVEGAVAPELLIPTALTTTLGGKYAELLDQGVAPDKALAIAGIHGALDAGLFAIMPAYSRVIESRAGRPIVKEIAKALATGDAFAATEIAHQAIDQYAKDGEIHELTGIGGAEGKGILLHTVMAMLGRAVGSRPANETQPGLSKGDRNGIDLTGTSGSFSEQVQAREAPGGGAVSEVPQGVGEAAQPVPAASEGAPVVAQGAEAAPSQGGLAPLGDAGQRGESAGAGAGNAGEPSGAGRDVGVRQETPVAQPRLGGAGESGEQVGAAERFAKIKATPSNERSDADIAFANDYARQQRAAQVPAAAPAPENRADAFTGKMSPMMAKRATNALQTNLQNGGRLVSRQALIESKIDSGSQVVEAANGKRRLQATDGSYLDESQISKTAMDYAEFLAVRRAAEPTELTAPPSPPVSEARAGKEPWQMTYDEFGATHRTSQAREDADYYREAVQREVQAQGRTRTAGQKYLTFDEMARSLEMPDGRSYLDMIRAGEAEPSTAEMHRKAIEDALARGERIPGEVLKDYPDIAEARKPWQMTREEYGQQEWNTYNRQLIDERSALRAGKIETGPFSKYKSKAAGLRAVDAELKKITLERNERGYGAFGDHYGEVARAIRAGKPVPPEVLADYPDLAADAAAARLASTVQPATEPARPPVTATEPAALGPQESNGGEPTAIKDEEVARQLKSMGFEPPQAEKHTFAEEYAKAKAKFDADPFAGQKLVEDLRTSDRPPNRGEVALLALEANRLLVERDAADQAVMDNPGDPGAKMWAAAASDAYNAAAPVFERTGGEASGSLGFRKMMIARDYSLAAMERREAIRENGGEPLSEKQRAEVKDLHDRITKTQAAFDAYVKEQEAKRADLESQLATEKLRTEVKARRPTREKPVREYISKKAEEAREFYRKGGTMLRGGALPIGPEDVSRIAFIAADHLAKGLDAAVELTKDFGERIKPHLEAILSKAREIVNVDKPLGRIEERLKEGQPLADQRAYVQKIAKHVLAEDPTLEREGLAGRVHEILKPVAPDITHEQTRDLISGYGEFKQASKEALDVRFRDLKGQMQQVAKLEDMVKRLQAPKKTGFEQREPSAEERKLIKEVNETKKRLGIKTTDPETQLKSALDSIKTRLQNEIEDMAPQIENRAPTPKGEKTPAPSDEESRALQAKRDEMKAQLDEIRQAQTKPGPTPDETKARQIKAALKATERQIADLQNPPKPRLGEPKPTSPELEAARERLKALREQRTFLDNMQNPQKSPEEIALQAFKARTAAATADLKERMARGDFEPAPRRKPTPLDPEAMRLQAESEAARLEFDKRKRTADLAKRTTFEKGADLLVSVERGIKLTSGGTIGKLAGSGVTRLGVTPIEELVGGFLGRAPGLKGIFERAPREGGLNVDALAKGYGYAWKNLLEQGAKKLKTGKWDYETAHLGGSPEAPEFVGFFGRLHGMLKTPEALNEFALSAAKREAWVAKNMRDPMNPLIQIGIGVDAAKDADASVFNQDSAFADAFNGQLRKLETPSKSTGRPTILGKTAATVARLEVPFAKVPSNIVAEAFTNAFGLVSGGIKAREVIKAGIENLTPEEADQVARHLKKGAIGAAVLLTGLFNHKNVGGFYTPGKRQPEDVKAGEMKIAGVTIGRWAAASPLGLVYQLGGTIGRIADSKLRRADTETQGIGMATIAGVIGLLKEIPLIEAPVDAIESLSDPYKREGFIGRHVAGDVIPSGISWVARNMDTDAQGEPIQRKAKTVGENIQAAIPGAREKLPVKQ